MSSSWYARSPVLRTTGSSKAGLTGRVEDFRRLAVSGMEEKPAKPRSQWAATAVYCLTSRIFTELNQARAESPQSELELTTGIVRLIAAGARVEALIINPRFAEWRSVGSPEGYFRALQRTRRVVTGASPFLEPLKATKKRSS